MPETMVERVAKAIFETWAKENYVRESWEDTKRSAMAAPEDSYPRIHRMVRLARLEARAAIQALREPTDAMLGAFDRMCDDNGQCLVKSGYRAMIDAALSEGAER